MTIRFLVDQEGPKIGNRVKDEIPNPDLPKNIEDLLIARGIAEPVVADDKPKKSKKKEVENDND